MSDHVVRRLSSLAALLLVAGCAAEIPKPIPIPGILTAHAAHAQNRDIASRVPDYDEMIPSHKPPNRVETPIEGFGSKA